MLENKMTKGDVKYVVVSKRSIHHQGDERSKLFPGHGYGEHIEIVDIVTEYFSNQELLDALAKVDLNFVQVYEVNRLNPKKTVTIDIN
jgi:hypothetical protein